jgi:hypothetical protein
MKKNIWIEDEYIFSLHLYHLVKNKKIKDSKDDPNFKEQYRIFQQIQKQNDLPDRSLNSLYLRVQNWKSIDPNWNGKGMDGADKNAAARFIFNKYFGKDELLAEFNRIVKSVNKKNSKKNGDNENIDILNILSKIIKKNNVDFEILDKTNPIILNCNNTDYIIHLSKIHSWDKKPHMRRIQVKGILKKYFKDSINENIVFAILGYSAENKTFTSWNVRSVFTDFKESKSLFTYDIYLQQAEDLGICHDMSILQTSDNYNISHNYPISFKEKYLNEFLKSHKKNKVEINNKNFYIKNFDHLNDENKNNQFTKLILDIENQTFTGGFAKKYKNHKIRNFRLNQASKELESHSTESDEINRLNLLDRATKLHQTAVNQLYTIFFRHGYSCYESLKSFDFLAFKSHKAYLIEVKSLSENNYRSQTRSALIQLEEYKYVHEKDFKEMKVQNLIKIVCYHTRPNKYSKNIEIAKYNEIGKRLKTYLYFISGQDIISCLNKEGLKI